MFQLNHDDNMLHFNEMMMMMMMMMVSACTRPTCLVTDLNGARLLQQQSVGTHVASLISGYTCRFTHIMMIPDQPVAIWSELIMKVEFKNVWRCQGGNQKRQCDGQIIQWSKEKDKHCQQSSTPIFTDIGGIVDHINILFMSENYRANKGNNKITELQTSHTIPHLNGNQLRCSGG